MECESRFEGTCLAFIGGGLFPQRSYQGGKVIAEEESNPRHADLNSLLLNVSPARVLGSYSAPVPQE